MHEAELIILGAGPAGMAAAARAAGFGLSVLLLDEQPRPGGQIWREVGRAGPLRGDLLGRDYTDGARHVDRLDHPGISHLGGASVWQVDPAGEVAFTRNGAAQVARGRRILLANGALERPMPLPGWTLPGVMTAGAAQILLKASGIVAERAVLVGAGPLIYLVAAQMVRAGTPPLALVETQTLGDVLRAARHLPRALAGMGYLLKGLGLLRELRRAGVARFTGATSIAIEGTGRAEAVTFTTGNGPQRIACDTVLLHHGVVPNTQASRSMDLPHEWDDAQRSFRPVVDAWGRSAEPCVFIAGDGAGIAGAKAATLTGQLSALAIAHDLGALPEADRDLAARPLRAKLALETAARPFLDRAYPPCAQALAPADETIICRCEEVTAGTIRHQAALGCLGPNQTKSFCRAGMGPCQGRYCGLTVTELLSACHGRPQQATGAYRIRAPLKPVTLGELANLAES
ncbi:FAD-dependent oxidoreductase [Aliigemmobacter aestuarii]|uniref:FAD-dependent oxidoreductase n=1 Tax=Aliigemmobacter aestuarii TaxID=1445661 RepID=A0A4S3MJ61_9RHOB|nr:NAD(P)/FAD-dependent oxidoreductase [Gemmobacter aestuarii]THD81459.1 FAD-dependent oxidoreductase [Gemmobacter aestuarii]